MIAIKQIKNLVIAGTLAALAFSSQAQTYYITGSDINGWNPSATPMTGGPAVYSIVLTNGTPGLNHAFKITEGSWSATWPGNNCVTRYDAAGNNTIYFRPGAIIDGWLPIANRVGYEDPGNLAFELAGDFNGWSGGAGYQLNPIGGGVYSNSIVIAAAGTYGFKFRTPGSWSDLYFGVDFGNGNANATLVTTNSPQTVPVRLDLTNGRYMLGNYTPPPVTNSVVFAVDMSSQMQLAKFNPAVDHVFVSGAFNGWPGLATNALALTNYPPYNGGGNTNIYYGTSVIVGTPNMPGSEYKFTCDSAADSGSGGYEPRASNRSFNLLNANGTLTLPVVSFGDAYASDFLAVDTLVTFTVNMANAVAGIAPSNRFDPGSMSVYLTGNFDDAGWAPAPWSWINMRQLTETTPGSGIYNYTHLVTAGHSVEIHYKYGFDDGVNSLDNEAPSYQDHIRVVRTLATGSYAFPQDTFGNQHVEPNVGRLSITPAAGGKVSVQFLGRPGAKLQSNTSLDGSPWTTYNATDGATWTGATVATSDGTASVTNLPASNAASFFRLLKGN